MAREIIIEHIFSEAPNYIDRFNMYKRLFSWIALLQQQEYNDAIIDYIPFIVCIFHILMLKQSKCINAYNAG